MRQLPYSQIWLCDAEFRGPEGLPEPVCIVARELHSGKLIRLWEDQFDSQPPFPIGPDSLFVAYNAAAELGVFHQLGWQMPVRILDLWAEFLAATNGRRPNPRDHGMLAALRWYHIPGISKAQKDSMRDLVLRGGPWSPSERVSILDYCQSDVDALEPLLRRMLPVICADYRGLVRALNRGRYTGPAVSHMTRNGIPIDVPNLDRIRYRWHAVKRDIVAEIDRGYGVFDGDRFKSDRWEAWIERQKIPWPRTDTGRIKLDRKTFRETAKTYPQVAAMHDLRNALSELRLEKLAVGPDGRNRAPLFPLCSRSGRNTPSANQFVFGPSVWIRGLIKPAPGRGIAYVDWSAQEVWIAAVLSGDQALLDALHSGDPYLAFAKAARLAPADATKQTHKQIRDLAKICLLGSNYGMTSFGLAQRVGVSLLEAEEIHWALKRTYPKFWEWAEHTTDVGELKGQLSTLFGWTMRVSAITTSNSIRNFKMQANGAEMMRLACCIATERGIQVDAPVHDALLVEGDIVELDDVVAATRKAMSEAARTVLAGVDIPTEADVVIYPDRYSDPRGQVMWDRVMGLLDRYDANPDLAVIAAAPQAAT